MSDHRWVRKIISGIVIGNLFVLTAFFLLPRMQFLLAHINLTSDQIMETTGSRDMPNQLSKTYAVVHRIRELTPVSARVFMPPGDRMNGSFRSAVIQVLYPRKIIFGDDTKFDEELNDAEKFKTIYFVFSPQWKPEFCQEVSIIKLTDFGFGMCKLNK